MLIRVACIVDVCVAGIIMVLALQKAVTSQKTVRFHVYLILCRFLYQRAVMSQKAVTLQKAGMSHEVVMLHKAVITSQKVVIWPR